MLAVKMQCQQNMFMQDGNEAIYIKVPIVFYVDIYYFSGHSKVPVRQYLDIPGNIMGMQFADGFDA